MVIKRAAKKVMKTFIRRKPAEEVLKENLGYVPEQVVAVEAPAKKPTKKAPKKPTKKVIKKTVKKVAKKPAKTAKKSSKSKKK